jgi:hypothetical protein
MPLYSYVIADTRIDYRTEKGIEVNLDDIQSVNIRTAPEASPKYRVLNGMGRFTIKLTNIVKLIYEVAITDGPGPNFTEFSIWQEVRTERSFIAQLKLHTDVGKKIMEIGASIRDQTAVPPGYQPIGDNRVEEEEGNENVSPVNADPINNSRPNNNPQGGKRKTTRKTRKNRKY